MLVTERYAAHVGHGHSAAPEVVAMGMTAQRHQFGALLLRLRAECDSISKSEAVRLAPGYKSPMREEADRLQKKVIADKAGVYPSRVTLVIARLRKAAIDEERAMRTTVRSERVLVLSRLKSIKPVRDGIALVVARQAVKLKTNMTAEECQLVVAESLVRWLWGGADPAYNGGFTADQNAVLRAVLRDCDDAASGAQMSAARKVRGR